MKKIFILVFAIFALIYFLLTHFFSDIQINKYPNLQEVKNDTAIQKGWIPAIIPDSAYNITETHDLDKNTIFGSFYYKEEDEEKFIQHLTDLNTSDHTLEWKDFLFKIDKKLNRVKFRNKPTSTQ